MKEQIEKFPGIKNCVYPVNIISYEQKCIFHEKLLLEYLKRAVNGWSIRDFLSTEKIENYALYAITDFTQIVCDDLRCNGLILSGNICDKRAEGYPEGYKNWNVIDIEKLVSLYQANEINKIIVLSVLHENKIIDDLVYKGIDLNDLISIVSVLYS